MKKLFYTIMHTFPNSLYVRYLSVAKTTCIQEGTHLVGGDNWMLSDLANGESGQAKKSWEQCQARTL